jgi:hypothetical protein
MHSYFVWSVMDNFEYVFGFAVRFGMYHVGFATHERTPKMWAEWYKDFLTGLWASGRNADCEITLYFKCCGSAYPLCMGIRT